MKILGTQQYLAVAIVYDEPTFGIIGLQIFLNFPIL